MSRHPHAPIDRDASERVEELARQVQELAEQISSAVQRLKEENDRDPAD